MQSFIKQKLFSYKINLPLTLIILLFYGLVSGPLIPEVLIFIGLIYLFLKKNNVAKIFSNNSKFFFYFFLFCTYLILNSFISDNYYLSFKNSLFFFRLLVPVFLIILAIEASEKSFDIITIFLFILVSLFLIDGIYSLNYGQNIFGLKVKLDRISSFFNDELIMGSFMIRIFPFYLGCLVLSSIKFKEIVLFISLIIFSTLIVLSGERTAFALLLLFLLSQIIFNQPIREKYFKQIIFSFIIIFLTVIFLHNTLIVKRLFLDTFNQIVDKNDKKISIFSQRHENHFLTGYLIFKNNLIAGSGVNSFRIECKKEIYSNEIYNKILDQRTFRSNQNGKFIIDEENINIIFENGKTETIKKDYIFKYLIFNEHNLNQEYNFQHKQPLWIVNLDYKDGCNTHPHNILIQFISELGIIGMFFLSIFYIYIIKSILELRKIENSNLKSAGCIVLFGLLVNYFPLLPYGNFFNNWFAIINILPLGLFLIIKKLNKS